MLCCTLAERDMSGGPGWCCHHAPDVNSLDREVLIQSAVCCLHMHEAQIIALVTSKTAAGQLLD